MIKIGKYVNTHGLKGEIRIISDFTRKDLIFVPGFKLYINNNEFIIKTYRKHKNYDMVTLENINSIDDIINLKSSNVYINREDINEFIVEDLFNYKVSINDKEYKIQDIIENKSHKIIVLEDSSMIPYVSEFISKIDEKNKILYMKVPNGMMR